MIKQVYEQKIEQERQREDTRQAFLASLEGCVSRIRPWLWIGRCVEASSPETIAQCGVGAMLHLVEIPTFEGVHSLFLDIPDAEPLRHEQIQQGLDFVQRQREAGRSVMIACAAGKSRSASFTIAALKAAENIPLLAAAREVQRLHSITFPHAELWKSLADYYGEEVSVEEMHQALHGISSEGRLIG